MERHSDEEYLWTIGGQHKAQFHRVKVSKHELEATLAEEWGRPFNAISISCQRASGADVVGMAGPMGRKDAHPDTVSRMEVVFRDDKAVVFYKDFLIGERRASYNMAVVGSPEGNAWYSFSPDSDNFDHHMFHVIDKDSAWKTLRSFLDGQGPLGLSIVGKGGKPAM